MGNGYTRQSTADIVTGATVTAAPLNNEFNALQSAFNSLTGHSHDGTSGEGPLINLTTSITGVLPVANGGFAAIHKIDATTAPTTTDDSGSGYGPGSVWIDTTNDVAYVCLDATSTAAVWDQISFNSSLDDIAALAKTDGNIIVGNGTNWVAESGATARTSLGLTIGTNVQAYDAGLASIAGLTTSADKMIYTTASDTYAVTDLTSFARSILDDTDEATFKATVNLEIGTDVQAYDAGLQSISGLTTAADKMIYTTASDTYAVTDLTSVGRALLDDTTVSEQLGTLSAVGYGVAQTLSSSEQTQARENIGAQASPAYSTKSTGYTALVADDGSVINCTAALTLSLTAAATLGSKWNITVKANGGDVTIDPNAAETIDGASTYVVYDGNSATVICDGTNFQVVHHGAIVTKWVAYTPTTQGLGTLANVNVYSRRNGSNLEIFASFDLGTTTAVGARIGIGFNGTDGNVNVASWISAGGQIVGPWASSTTAVISPNMLAVSGEAFLRFVYHSSGVNGLASLNGTSVGSSGQTVSFTVSFPIEGW